MITRATERRAGPPLPLPRKLSLADAVADSIAQAIAEGVLRPGDKVVETSVAEQMNVSRVPVREALKILATQGVLQGGRQSYQIAAFNERSKSQLQDVRVTL